MLIQADDETLLECLVINADPKNDVDIYEFDLKAVTEYRKLSLIHICKMRLSGKRPRPERLDRQPGRSCAVPFLPGG